AREGRARHWGDEADRRLPEGALPRTGGEHARARSQCRAGESVHDAATIVECVGAVSLNDENGGDRKRKTPNRRAERIASLPVTRNRRRAAFSSQVLQRFPSAGGAAISFAANPPGSDHAYECPRVRWSPERPLAR